MVTGGMEWLKVKEISIMLMVMSIKESSIRIGLMDLEFTFIKMDRLMKDFGKTICKMVLEKKSLKMDPSMMVCLKMAKSGAKEHINGLMIQFTQETG